MRNYNPVTWWMERRKQQKALQAERKPMEHWLGFVHLRIKDTSAYDAKYPKWRKKGLTLSEFTGSFRSDHFETTVPDDPFAGWFDIRGGRAALTPLGVEKAREMVSDEEQEIMLEFRAAMSDLILSAARAPFPRTGMPEEEMEELSRAVHFIKRASARTQYCIELLSD